MKRLIAMFAAGVLLCVCGAARADRSSSLHRKGHNLMVGLDTEFSVPLGNYADVNSVGAGAIVTGELPLLEAMSATARVGFQAHADRTVGGLGSHVHAIPFLLGARYNVSGDRQGIFGAFELGIFDLMSSVDRRVGNAITTTTSNDVKFGMGVGVGLQQERWSVRVNVHAQDVSNFGSSVTLTGGIGCQFASF
jgi:hypothetical protein